MIEHKERDNESHYFSSLLEAESTGTTRVEHDERRDLLAAMEKALAEALTAAGCLVMNRVVSRKRLDAVRFEQVRKVFAGAFPQLAGFPGAF